MNPCLGSLRATAMIRGVAKQRRLLPRLLPWPKFGSQKVSQFVVKFLILLVSGVGIEPTTS